MGEKPLQCTYYSTLYLIHKVKAVKQGNLMAIPLLIQLKWHKASIILSRLHKKIPCTNKTFTDYIPEITKP